MPPQLPPHFPFPLPPLLSDLLTALPSHCRTYTIVLLRHIHALRCALIRFRSVDDALFNVGRKAIKRLLDVDVALGRHLHEGNTQLVGELLTSLHRHRPLFLPVAFISDQNLVDAFGGVLLDIGKPGPNICNPRN